MDLAFDLENASPGRAGGDGSRENLRLAKHPSWAELRMRLFAAREASDSLARGIASGSLFDQGSFDDTAAAYVAALQEPDGSVNPNVLGNCKSGGATTSTVAGHPRTGGRG